MLQNHFRKFLEALDLPVFNDSAVHDSAMIRRHGMGIWKREMTESFAAESF
jgi:hypothetical protein